MLKHILFGAAALGLGLAMAQPLAHAAGEAPVPPAQEWSFAAPFGKFDRGQLQRGLKVYKEVCAACHGMRLLSFRNLGEPGGPEFDEEFVKTMASQQQTIDGPNDDGEMFERPGIPADRFRSPYRNEKEARSIHNGAYPPDLSVIAKARPHTVDYLHGLLVGYKDAPAGFVLADGMNYNEYFPGHQIAMAAPLSDDLVEYTDGTPQTVDQYARDVTAFLMWAAEPKLEQRHAMGLQVLIYLSILAFLLYLTKRKIWSKVDH